MNAIMKKSVLATMLAGGVLASVANQAHAEAYATSFLNLTGGFLSFSNPGNVTLGTSVDTSKDSATLNGANQSGGGIGFTDAPAVNAPASEVTRLNNVYNLFGPGSATYSNADASIPTRQSAGNPFTQTLQIAESELNKPQAADANTENSSLTGFSVTFNVLAPTALSFSFYASEYLRALLNSANVLGQTALATTNVVLSIQNASGATVFNWAPDGLLGSGVAGGTEGSDAFNLNVNDAAAFLGDDHIISNGAGVSTAAGTGSPALGTYVAPAGFGFFSATTNTLLGGTYTLSLSAKNSTGVTATAPIPEPATLALLGIGIAGMGAATRRRKQV